ncbi:hypothetical protein F2Q69_00035384 [Brassica cretica]|uniref:Uncharacterized protein n=1 Tax=Brassica cretica TaxID=69181 RepID=A0A8S9SRK2_BRACR|nr:hypothetical protein F2Q69_00035384 [Brassica cretica]
MSETTCSSSSQIVPTVAMKALSSNKKVFHSTWMFITWKYPWKISCPMFTSKFLIMPLELNLEQSTKVKVRFGRVLIDTLDACREFSESSRGISRCWDVVAQHQ